MPNARPQRSFSDTVAEVTGFPLSRPLQNASRVGSFFPVLQQSFSAANTDTPVSVNLGRVPSGYLIIRTPPGGGQVTDGSQLGADWTTTSITLQATAAGSYSLLLF